MKDLEIVYINLESSLDRRLAMERKLQFFFDSSEYNRFAAILGDDRPTRISKSELGCFRSHQKVIENSSTSAYTLILEDDVIFSSNFKKQLEIILNHLKSTSSSWDIFFLAQMTDLGNIRATYQLINLSKTLGTKSSQEKLKIINSKSFYASGCSSYILNPKSKYKVCSLLSKFSDAGFPLPIDLCLMNLINNGAINSNFIFPYITGLECNGDSTVQPSNRQAKSNLMEDQLNIFFVDQNLEILIKKYTQNQASIENNKQAYIASRILFERFLI